MTKQNIYIIRHGQTYLNYYKKFQGWSDAPLTPEGIEVVTRSAKGLSEIKFDKVYTSDLQRTIDTAKIFLSYNKVTTNPEIIPLKGLREAFYGSFEGSHYKPICQSIAKDNGWQDHNYLWKLNGPERFSAIRQKDPQKDAEDYDSFSKRVLESFRKIIKENHSQNVKNIMLVAHNGVIRTLGEELFPSVEKPSSIANASVSKIIYQTGKLTLESYSDTSHFV